MSRSSDSTIGSQKRRAIFLVGENLSLRDQHLLRLLEPLLEIELLRLGSGKTELLPDTSVRITDVPPSRSRSKDTNRSLRLFKTIGSLGKTVTDLGKQVIAGTPAGCDPAIVEILKHRAASTELLWVSRLKMAPYIPLGRSLGYRVLFDEPTAESSALYTSAFSSIRRWHKVLSAAQTAYREERFCSASHMVVTTSDIQASRLRKLVPEVPVRVVPASVDAHAFTQARGGQAGRTLLTFGPFDQAYFMEGLIWFWREVLPRLRASLGNDLPKVAVLGSDTHTSKRPRRVLRAIEVLKDFGFEVHPSPGSIHPFLSESAAVFFPIRSSSPAAEGARYRVLSAMAAGRAVVTTGRAAEGLLLSPSYDSYLADRADTFSTALIRLLRDPELRSQIGARAIRTVEERYDWRCSEQSVREILDEI